MLAALHTQKSIIRISTLILSYYCSLQDIFFSDSIRYYYSIPRDIDRLAISCQLKSSTSNVSPLSKYLLMYEINTCNKTVPMYLLLSQPPNFHIYSTFLWNKQFYFHKYFDTKCKFKILQSFNFILMLEIKKLKYFSLQIKK